MKSKIKYIVLIVFLVAFAFTFTSAVAYWSTELDTTNIVVEVSDVDASLIVDDNNEEFTGYLVPEGYAFFVGEVTEVVFTYEVSLDKELINIQSLVVEKLEVTIGGETTYAHLVEVTIGDEIDIKEYDLYNDIVTVIVRVRLIEPIDSEEALEKGISLDRVNVEDSLGAYESIKGQQINIKIGFRFETRTIN
ncbi:MAG: hypothetical protein RBR66_02345 [Candidatus Izemoplasmatales bacterium]|nr:hypothetical protein [Candidatus Izemoplasmatales bacterium]